MIKPTKFFKALSDPTKEKIMRLLRKHQELNVGSLTEKLGLAQPTVSQHLRILSEAGVVKMRKEGREVRFVLVAREREARRPSQQGVREVCPRAD